MIVFGKLTVKKNVLGKNIVGSFMSSRYVCCRQQIWITHVR